MKYQYVIKEIKASKWAGRYVPKSWRIDKLDEKGRHLDLIGVYSSLKEAKEMIESLKD